MTDRDTTPDSSAHTPGVHKAEERSSRGHTQRRAIRRGRTSRDSTSINADKRAPIDPRMPDLPPA